MIKKLLGTKCFILCYKNGLLYHMRLEFAISFSYRYKEKGAMRPEAKDGGVAASVSKSWGHQ
jgi:hypothetical protein